MRTIFFVNGHSRKFMHSKSWKIGTIESLTVIALSEAMAIAMANTVCQIAINLKLARVCMRSLVNSKPQYKKYLFLCVYPYNKDDWKAKWKYTNIPFAKVCEQKI